MTKTIGLLILSILSLSNPTFANEDLSNNCLLGNKVMFKDQLSCLSVLGENCPNDLVASFVKEMEFIYLNEDQYVLRAYLDLKATKLEACLDKVATDEDYQVIESSRMAYSDEFEIIQDLLRAKQPFLGVTGKRLKNSQSLSDFNFEIIDSSKIKNVSSYYVIDDQSYIKRVGGEFAGGGIVSHDLKITIPKDEAEKLKKKNNSLEDESSDDNQNAGLGI